MSGRGGERRQLLGPQRPYRRGPQRDHQGESGAAGSRPCRVDVDRFDVDGPALPGRRTDVDDVAGIVLHDQRVRRTQTGRLAHRELGDLPSRGPRAPPTAPVGRDHTRRCAGVDRRGRGRLESAVGIAGGQHQGRRRKAVSTEVAGREDTRSGDRVHQCSSVETTAGVTLLVGADQEHRGGHRDAGQRVVRVRQRKVVQLLGPLDVERRGHGAARGGVGQEDPRWSPLRSAFRAPDHQWSETGRRRSREQRPHPRVAVLVDVGGPGFRPLQAQPAPSRGRSADHRLVERAGDLGAPRTEDRRH